MHQEPFEKLGKCESNSQRRRSKTWKWEPVI